jgi:putative ABC transport system permease protein
MHSFLLDLRHAARGLLRRPGFTLLATLALGIGLGVNVIAFSAMNALLWKPHGLAHPDRTGWVVAAGPENPYGYLTRDEYRMVAAETGTFDAVIAEARLPVGIRLGGQTEQGWGMLITPGYMELLGERPRAGRFFTAADEEGGALPVLVSERFAARVLGDGAPLGTSITVNATDFRITGVVRDGFQGPGGLYEPDLWLPLARADVLWMNRGLQDGAGPWLMVVARAPDGVSRAAIEGRLGAILADAPDGDPQTRRSARWHPMSEPHPQVRGLGRLAWMALAVIGVVLVIAGFNLAGLLLARASERQPELALKTALGAGRWRIVRQFVLEGLLLATAGGAAALVVAAWSADLLSAFSLPSPIPQRLHMGLDARLIAYTVALVALAGMLPALVAALRATRADTFHLAKRTAGAGGSRLRGGFIVAQVAGSTVFVGLALLFARSFTHLASADPGFDYARVAVVEMQPATYDAARTRDFLTALRDRAAALPEVRDAALADRVPYYVGFTRTAPVATGAQDCAVVACPEAVVYAVGTGHFAALGIPLLEGRDLAEDDQRHGTAVVISRFAAERFWPGESPVGRSLRLGKDGRLVQVVGVAADIRHRSPEEQPRAYVYRPLADEDFAGSLSLVVRTAGDPGRMLASLQAQAQALDPRLPPPATQTMSQRMEMPLWPSRTAAGMLSICGVLALLLAGVGLFGTTWMTVAQRTREFGIRAALGATPRGVLGLVLREGLTLSAPGVLLGMAGAYAAARLVSAALVGVAPGDPLSFGATGAIQILVATAATLLPAWRATRADPLVALRHE